MADSERRYGPTIDLQGFDLKTEMDAVDEPSRLPLVVLIALVVLAAFAGVVWLAYTQGVERGRESVSREIVTQSLWKLHKPEAAPYAGLKIYEQPPAPDEAAGTNPKVAPERTMATAIPALRPTAGATPDTPVQAAQTASPHADTTPASTQSAAALPANKKTTLAAASKSDNAAAGVATRAPTELTKPPAATPIISHPITGADSQPNPAPLKPSIAASPPAPPVVAAKPKAAPAAALKGVVLQIGSYKSEPEAMESWRGFKSRHAAAAHYQPDVKQANLGAKGTWYRLRIGPFADRKAALETCAKLKADGASCLLAQ